MYALQAQASAYPAGALDLALVLPEARRYHTPSVMQNTRGWKAEGWIVMRELIGALVVFFCLSAVARAATLPHNASPSSLMAYVGGNFVLDTPLGRGGFIVGFVIKNEDSAKEYLLPFGTKKDFLPGNTETLLIEVPPGTYHLVRWIVFGSYNGPGWGNMTKKPFEVGQMTIPFTLKAGEIEFLGRFSSDFVNSGRYPYINLQFHWKPIASTEDEAKGYINNDYPAFASSVMRCFMCSIRH